MRLRASLIAVTLMVASAALIFHFFQRQLTRASFAFGAHPEVVEHLEESLEDQKLLAKLDDERSESYRSRFDDIQRTVQRLHILDSSQDGLVRRYQWLLLSIFAASVIAVTGIYAYRQSRHEPRLSRLQAALTMLADGRTDVTIGDRGRDSLGRIAAMIERTSRVMARDRRRLASLRNLSAWQEAARRHAHEMRTPLTGAQLELTRVRDLLETERLERSEEILQGTEGALDALDRLGVFTRRFTDFARLPHPRLERHNLGDLVTSFSSTYGRAWTNLSLEISFADKEPAADVEIDREMLRQVLVNLCDNSSHAAAPGAGRVSFSLASEGDRVLLDVTDRGPGIPAEIEARIFEPYTTTRSVGEGMGLGLAISKKILLDHDGDLELVESSPAGTRFRLILPRAGGDGADRSDDGSRVPPLNPDPGID